MKGQEAFNVGSVDFGGKTIDGKNRCDTSFCKNVGWGRVTATCISLEMPEKLITSRLIASIGGLIGQKCGIQKIVKFKSKE